MVMELRKGGLLDLEQKAALIPRPQITKIFPEVAFETPTLGVFGYAS